MISNPFTFYFQLSSHLFFRYDVDRSNYIDLMELKLMMEKLGEPQTHIGLKEMIKEVDEDNDGQISFREVIMTTMLLHVHVQVYLSFVEALSTMYMYLIYFKSNSTHVSDTFSPLISSIVLSGNVFYSLGSII